MRRLLTLFCLLLTTSLAFGQTSESAEPAIKSTVTVYFYHDMPPYVVESKRHIGLYYDFVRMLNQVQKEWHFRAEFLPRIRIDYMLDHDLLPGILLGVNPVWFKDKEQKRFFWSQTVFEDQDILVSRIDEPVPYQGPESLFGKKIAGVLGYYYYGISEAAQLNQLTLVDNASMEAVLKRVLRQQADSGIVGQAFFNYTIKTQGWEDLFSIADTPHDRFTRHLLIPRRYPELKAPIDRWIKQLQQDPYWDEHVARVVSGEYRYPP